MALPSVIIHLFFYFTDGHPIQIHPLNMVILIFTLYVPIYFGKVRCLKYANKRQYIWHMLIWNNIVTVSIERCFMKWNLLCRVSECCASGNHMQVHSISWRVWYKLWQMTPPHVIYFNFCIKPTGISLSVSCFCIDFIINCYPLYSSPSSPGWILSTVTIPGILQNSLTISPKQEQIMENLIFDFKALRYGMLLIMI